MKRNKKKSIKWSDRDITFSLVSIIGGLTRGGGVRSIPEPHSSSEKMGPICSNYSFYSRPLAQRLFVSTATHCIVLCIYSVIQLGLYHYSTLGTWGLSPLLVQVINTHRSFIATTVAQLPVATTVMVRQPNISTTARCCKQQIHIKICLHSASWQCNATQEHKQRNTAQYNTTQYSAMQRNATKYNAIQHNTIQCNATQCNATMQCNANVIQNNVMLYAMLC